MLNMLKDKICIYRRIITVDSMKARVRTYPATPTSSGVRANVQQGGRVGARDALTEGRSGQYLNSPTKVFLVPGQDVLEGDKLVVTHRAGVALSAAEKARETYYVEEVTNSPVRRTYKMASCGTEEGNDR